MKKLCVAGQKGGIGKSTLTAHVAHAALEAGLRVLLVDFDAQANLGLCFPPAADAKPGLLASQLFTEDSSSLMPEVVTEKLSIIRANSGLLSIDKAENSVIRQPSKMLQQFSKDFDLCLIDTPPLLGVRLFAALTASDYVVTPVSVGLFELAGVADLVQTIHVVRTQSFNPRLRHIGILPSKINLRAKEQSQGLTELRTKYGSNIFAETLPERAAVRTAISKRRPVWVATRGDGHAKAGKEWRAACAAILSRMGL